MKKLFIICIASFVSIGCQRESLIENKRDQTLTSAKNNGAQNNISLISPSSNPGMSNDKSTVEISKNDIKLSAHISPSGQIKILNYPDTWEGAINLVRYNGLTTNLKLYSKEHCEKIRTYYIPQITRSGFYSALNIEIPYFMSIHFMDDTTEAVKNTGTTYSAIELENKIDFMKGEIELSFTDNSITKRNGDIDKIADQLNLRTRGTELERG